MRTVPTISFSSQWGHPVGWRSKGSTAVCVTETQRMALKSNGLGVRMSEDPIFLLVLVLVDFLFVKMLAWCLMFKACACMVKVRPHCKVHPSRFPRAHTVRGCKYFTKCPLQFTNRQSFSVRNLSRSAPYSFALLLLNSQSCLLRFVSSTLFSENRN